MICANIFILLLSLQSTNLGSLGNYHLLGAENYSDSLLVMLYDWSYPDQHILIVLLDEDGNYTNNHAQIDNCGFARLYKEGLVIFPRTEMSIGNAIVYKMIPKPYGNGLAAEWQWSYSPHLNTDSDGNWLYLIPLPDERYLATGGDSWAMQTRNWMALIDSNGASVWDICNIDGFQGWLCTVGDNFVLDCESKLTLVNIQGEVTGSIEFENLHIAELCSSDDFITVGLYNDERDLYLYTVDMVSLETTSFPIPDGAYPAAYYTQRPELHSLTSNGKCFTVADNLLDRNIAYTIYGNSLTEYWRAEAPDDYWDFNVVSLNNLENNLLVTGVEESIYGGDRIITDVYSENGNYLNSNFINGVNILSVIEYENALIIVYVDNSGVVRMRKLYINQDAIIDESETVTLFNNSDHLNRIYLSAYPLIVADYNDNLIVVKSQI